MEKSSNEIFLEIFTNIMLANHPECILETNQNKSGSVKNVFRLDSKNMKIEVHRTAFYFQLNPEITRQVERFKKNKAWYVQQLKFSIQLTASTGKTYSYPKLRNHLGDCYDDILMTAAYIYTCVDFTIKFFERGIEEENTKKIMSFVNEQKVVSQTLSIK